MTAPLDDLLARLESATEGDRELDCEIAVAVLDGEIEWKQANYTMEMYPVRRYASTMHIGGIGGDPVERYTTSIDAAMTLMPEGWWVQYLGQRIKGWAVRIEAQGISIPSSTAPLRAATPALALCIAALRARQP